MLPEHLKELLTASVDGELSTAERRIVGRLLRTSEPARVFHAQLVADAGRLRQLPKSTPDFDFAAAIVNAIVEEDIRPTPLPTRKKRPSWNNSVKVSWLPMLVAASVILMVSVGTYFYLASSKRSVSRVETPDTSKTTPRSIESQPKKDAGSNSRRTETVVQTDPEVGPAPRRVEERIVVKHEAESLPMPRTVDKSDLLTTPSPQSQPMLEIVDNIRLPLILPLCDLDQAYPREKFREDLKKDEVIRIDLFARDTARATETLQAILRSKGHHVIVEALVAEHLHKKQAKEILFFTESLTLEEFAQLFEQLGMEDKKLETKRTGDGIFGKFVLAPFLSGDVDKLARLLGVPVNHLKMPKPKAVPSFDIRKPLEESTANALVQNFPKNKNPEKLTMVLSYSPMNATPQHSKEIKTFLEKRTDRKPGTVPVLLVMRTMN